MAWIIRARCRAAAAAVNRSFCKPGDARAVANGTAGTVVNVQPCETVDEWTYNPGYGQFITTLRFESGVLKSVHYGDRVR